VNLTILDDIKLQQEIKKWDELINEDDSKITFNKKDTKNISDKNIDYSQPFANSEYSKG
jgi:Fe-S cluster assembly iron-binding protein IscA